MKINSINNNYNNKQNSFKGYVPRRCIRDITTFYRKVADNKNFQNGIHSFSHSNDTFKHILAIESAILSSFYMICTLANKKIEDEQKPQMIINDTLTLGFATLGAYLTDDKINDTVANKVDKFFVKNKQFYVDLGKEDKESRLSELLTKTEESFENKVKCVDNSFTLVDKHLKDIVGKKDNLKAFQVEEDVIEKLKTSIKETITQSENVQDAKNKIKALTEDLYESASARGQANKISSGISKLKGIVIFGFIYRFVSPVVFTPIANKLSSIFFPSKKEQEDK